MVISTIKRRVNALIRPGIGVPVLLLSFCFKGRLRIMIMIISFLDQNISILLVGVQSHNFSFKNDKILFDV